MDLENALKAGHFLNDISLSIKKIIFANFPQLSAEEREDIDQEVKLKLCRMAASGKKIRNIRSYLWRMVYTTTLDVIGKRLESLPCDEAAGGEELWMSDRLDLASPERLAEKSERKRIVEKAVESLPERRRLVVKLHLMGMGIEEMAEFLAWSQNKVRHLLYRGLTDLKKHFGEEAANGADSESKSRALRSAKKLVLKESDY